MKNKQTSEKYQNFVSAWQTEPLTIVDAQRLCASLKINAALPTYFKKSGSLSFVGKNESGKLLFKAIPGNPKDIADVVVKCVRKAQRKSNATNTQIKQVKEKRQHTQTTPAPSNSLMSVPTETLVAELKRRGFSGQLSYNKTISL